MKDYTDIDPLLGKKSDLAISKQFGRNQSAISTRRRSRNIAPFNWRKVNWIEWDYKIGKQSDYSLAKEIGTSVENVFHRRKVLKIKTYKGNK
jgi:hypothetical protein